MQFLRRLVEDFSEIARPFTGLTKKIKGIAAKTVIQPSMNETNAVNCTDLNIFRKINTHHIARGCIEIFIMKKKEIEDYEKQNQGTCAYFKEDESTRRTLHCKCVRQWIFLILVSS